MHMYAYIHMAMRQHGSVLSCMSGYHTYMYVRPYIILTHLALRYIITLSIRLHDITSIALRRCNIRVMYVSVYSEYLCLNVLVN